MLYRWLLVSACGWSSTRRTLGLGPHGWVNALDRGTSRYLHLGSHNNSPLALKCWSTVLPVYRVSANHSRGRDGNLIDASFSTCMTVRCSSKHGSVSLSPSNGLWRVQKRLDSGREVTSLQVRDVHNEAHRTGLRYFLGALFPCLLNMENPHPFPVPLAGGTEQ